MLGDDLGGGDEPVTKDHDIKEWGFSPLQAPSFGAGQLFRLRSEQGPPILERETRLTVMDLGDVVSGGMVPGKKTFVYDEPVYQMEHKRTGTIRRLVDIRPELVIICVAMSCWVGKGKGITVEAVRKICKRILEEGLDLAPFPLESDYRRIAQDAIRFLSVVPARAKAFLQNAESLRNIIQFAKRRNILDFSGGEMAPPVPGQVALGQNYRLMANNAEYLFSAQAHVRKDGSTAAPERYLITVFAQTWESVMPILEVAEPDVYTKLDGDKINATTEERLRRYSQLTSLTKPSGQQQGVAANHQMMEGAVGDGDDMAEVLRGEKEEAASMTMSTRPVLIRTDGSFPTMTQLANGPAEGPQTRQKGKMKLFSGVSFTDFHGGVDARNKAIGIILMIESGNSFDVSRMLSTKTKAAGRSRLGALKLCLSAHLLTQKDAEPQSSFSLQRLVEATDHLHEVCIPNERQTERIVAGLRSSRMPVGCMATMCDTAMELLLLHISKAHRNVRSNKWKSTKTLSADFDRDILLELAICTPWADRSPLQDAILDFWKAKIAWLIFFQVAYHEMTAMGKQLWMDDGGQGVQANVPPIDRFFDIPTQ